MPIVVGGGEAAFDSMVYGQQSPKLMEALAAQYQNLPPIVCEMQRAFIDRSRQIFETVQNSSAVRMAKAAYRGMSSLWGEDCIRRLDTIGELQHAPDAMVRWLMAESTISKMYHDQTCEGYGERFVNRYPGLFGEDNPDWRNVMSGVVVETDKGWYAKQYWDDVPEEDALDPHDRITIVETWELQKYHALRKRDDPTSPLNASL